MLCHMEVPELMFLCTCDALMVVAGYAAFVAVDPRAVWPLYAFSEWAVGRLGVSAPRLL
jgi:hypothetical protein